MNEPEDAYFSKQLASVGLNLQAVLNLDELPENLVRDVSRFSDTFCRYRHLLLLGNGGKSFWQAIKTQSPKGVVTQNENNPIDCFSTKMVEQYFSKYFDNHQFEVIYPHVGKAKQTECFLPLQQLGELVGWHQESPFKVGINQHWGSWFAYRAVVLFDELPTAYRAVNDCFPAISPCDTCSTRDCINACPANALDNDQFDLLLCTCYRKRPNSKCRDRCLARMACPVSRQNQYTLEQIQYHYSSSMKVIEQQKCSK